MQAYGNHIGCLQTRELRNEEDHPRGRRCGGRIYGSHRVRLGWRGALPDAVHDDHRRAAGRRGRPVAERLDAHLQRHAEPVRRLVRGRRLAQSARSTASTTPRRSRATLDGDNVSFTAKRDSDGLVYSLSNAPLDNSTVTLATSTRWSPWALEFKVGATTTTHVELQEPRRVRQGAGRRLRRGPLVHRDAHSLAGIDH